MRFLFALLLALSVPAHADDTVFGIKDAYIRATPARISAGYMTIINPTDQRDSVIAVSASWCSYAELHTIQKNVAGILEMKKIRSIPVPANGTTVLQPGGYHIMFFGVNKRLKTGATETIRLAFRSGRTQDVDVAVQPITYRPDSDKK